MTRTLLRATVAAACLALAAPALAQNLPASPPAANGGARDTQPVATIPFQPNGAGSTTLAAGASSTSAALPSTDPTVLVQNPGAVTAYVVLGGSGVVATTSGTPIGAGCTVPLYAGASPNAATYIAGITATGSTSLNITTGKGSASAVCSGGGGSGGAVTQGAGSSANPWYFTQGGTVGTDYSANTPTLPNVGAAFAASGPYASYVLLKTIPASTSRNCAHVENVSGAQVALVLDDGTASGGSAPANASVFALSGGAGTGQQGASTDISFCAFKGRVQIYAASSSAQVFAAVW